MRTKSISAAVAQHFSQKRIARAIVAVFVFTLIQTILVPSNYLVSASAAVVTTGTCTLDGTNISTSNIIDSSTIDGTCMVRLTSGTASFTAPTGVNSIASLVVGGGGGGGFGGNGGGGGAGTVMVTTVGLATSAAAVISGTVGDGGATGWNATQSSWTKGGKGFDSSLTIGASTFIAKGGGGGGAFGTWADNGGSGGGEAINGNRDSVTQIGYGLWSNVDYASWMEYAYDGGPKSGVGGGGGGGAGGSPSSSATSNGGVGVSIWGFKVGGGGSGWGGGLASDAAPFGGGGPRVGTGADGCSSCNGVANTGGGGGGGGAGGSGLVIIKYVPARGQGTIAQSNGYQINRKTTFAFTRTGTAPASTTASYQWQVKASGSSTWSNVSTGTGATTLTYQTANLTSADNGNSYRIAVTDSQATYGISTTTYTEVSTLALFLPPGGETDSALVLNGTNQFAWAADDNALDIDNAFTFQAWVKPSSINSGVWNIVFGKYGSFQIGISTTGKWAYAFAGATDINGASTSVLAVVDEWHHIAFTRAASTNTLNFYYDGQLAGTYTGNTVPTGALTNSAGIFSVGALRASTSASEKHFSGSIDQVAIYSTVRSEPTIKEDMNSYLNISDINLKLYYDFNEGLNSTIFNRISGASSNSDLAITGAGFSDVKIIDTPALSAYTIVKFPRSYLTSLGGWKVPVGVTRITTLVVAGGGAGGRSDSTAYEAGGGGAGGVIFRTLAIESASVNAIVVGVGGYGAGPSPESGKNSSAFSLTAIGGGYGAFATGVGGTGGSGGGGTHPRTAGGAATSGQGFAGETPAAGGSGGGGGGATSSGVNGVGGMGFQSNISGSNVYYGDGGGAGRYGSTGSLVGGSGNGGTGAVGLGSSGSPGVVNTGSGGGGGYSSNDTSKGGNGGSGIVVVRWITASKPSYTKPTNTYLNVGMTETFSTTVAVDSATVGLTRTFKWESNTPTSSGTFTLIKQGTGAANASFSWVPTDTSTSGSNYLYRLTVTDSDTAGLFITDSSTAFAIINRALVVSGTAGIAKTINVSKSETFTITLGTSTYRTTLTSNNPGISLDTTTATSPVVRIADTMTVGTYYETLTVVDSVSASVVTPLTIVVSAPPNFLNTSEIITDGLLLNYEIGNSASLISESGTATSGQAIVDLSGRGNHANTGAGVNTGAATDSSCNAPTFSSENGGALRFSGNNCYYTTYTGNSLEKSYTAEIWFKLESALPASGALVSQARSSTAKNVSLQIGRANAAGLIVGFWDGSLWRYANCPITPTIGQWTHIIGTYNGSQMRTYLNGSNTINGSACFATYGGGLSGTANNQGLILGKNWLGDSASGSPFTIGSFRLYSKPFTSDQVLANYNATKYRFQVDNFNLITPTQKYGLKSSESFTATSGYGARTISTSAVPRSGWSLSISGDVTTLVMSETQTASTHYDTITVTDSLGASTYLPIKMTVSKADTLTISMDTATTVVYNAAPITVYPKVYFKGLAGVDTLTASTRFTSLTYTDSATVPTDVDTYTVIAANPVFTVGALSNYVAVVYETSTARVTQANQNKLTINLYGAVAGSPFLIQTFGGSGDGVVTESVTDGSTASGCAVSNHVLSNTSPSTQQLTCNILVTKAASKNYKVETLTATVYFMLYINNMPTNQVGGGSTIGLNGINSVWVDPGAVPTITGPGAGTYSANSSITITGSGFSLGPITVKFERNQLGSNITVASDTSMTVTIPSGARTGVFSVTNRNGTEYSSFVITIS